MTDKKNFLTVEEFAKIIRVNATTVRRGIQSGRYQAFRVGEGSKSSYRIPHTETDRLCELDMSKLIERIVEEKINEKMQSVAQEK